MCRNTALSPFPDGDFGIMACPTCGSGEFLHNEDGNRNRYCGQCGQAIDWDEDGFESKVSPGFETASHERFILIPSRDPAANKALHTYALELKDDEEYIRLLQYLNPLDKAEAETAIEDAALPVLAQKDGRSRSNIRIGDVVDIVLPQDKPTGTLTRGVVARFLTNSPTHPHGIKVLLTDGRVGRVKIVYSVNHDGLGE